MSEADSSHEAETKEKDFQRFRDDMEKMLSDVQAIENALAAGDISNEEAEEMMQYIVDRSERQNQ